MAKGLCRVCVEKAVALEPEFKNVEGFPVCVVYRDEPRHWARLFYECLVVKAVVADIVEESGYIEAEVRRSWGGIY